MVAQRPLEEIFGFNGECLPTTDASRKNESMTGADLFGWLIFGAIGFVAFMYGKRQVSWKAMAIGAALMVYPYFVSNTIAMYIVGVVLTAALFVFRD